MKDRIPEHDASWRARWEKMTGSLNAADEGQLQWDRNLNPLSLLVAFVGGVLVAVICLIQNDVEGKWFIAAAIGAIGVAIVALWPSRPAEASRAGVPGALGQVGVLPALDGRLPAAEGRSARHARALEADPDLRSGLRHRGPNDQVRADPGARASELESDPGRPATSPARTSAPPSAAARSARGSRPRSRPSPPAVAEAASAAAVEAAAGAAVEAAGRRATAYSSPAAFSAVPRSWNS